MSGNPALSKIACVQMRSGTNQAANITAMQQLVREAAKAGAKYVQTPEMTGLVQRERAGLLSQIAPEANNPVFAAAQQLALDLNIWLHIGSTAVLLADDRVANRAAVFAPSGERVASYDKIHMFDVNLDNGETWRESAIYEAGDTSIVVHGPALPVGLSICYDLRFPELFRAQALAGAELLTCPACFTRQTGKAHWHALLRARAIENGAFVAAAAQGGVHADGRETFGHSLVFDPWGVLIGELAHDEPGVLICEIETGKANEARRKIPNLSHGREFSVRIESESGVGGHKVAAQ